MKDFPFSVHDFFAYLASGLLLLAIVDYALDLPWKMPHGGTIQLVLVVVVAYALGQVLSYLSSLVIEQFFVTWLMGRTDVALLGEEATKKTRCRVRGGEPKRCSLKFEDVEEATVAKDYVCIAIKTCAVKKHWKDVRQSGQNDKTSRPLTLGVAQTYYKNCQFRAARRRYYTRWLRRTVFRKAYEPLPPKVRKRVLARAKDDDVKGAGVIIRAQASAKTDDRTFARMGTFLYLYEFARNACLSFILGFGALIWGGLYYGDRKTKLYLALLCATAGVIMLFRYLDFHRRYNAEVLRAYAFPTTQQAPTANK